MNRYILRVKRKKCDPQYYPFVRNIFYQRDKILVYYADTASSDYIQQLVLPLEGEYRLKSLKWKKMKNK